MKKPKLVIFGGGTFVYTACHFATAAPAFGQTARQIHSAAKKLGFASKLVLTKMADHKSDIVTNDHLTEVLFDVLDDKRLRAIVFNAAVCDFMVIPTTPDNSCYIPSSITPRLKTSEGDREATLVPTYKLVDAVKKNRPDICLVTFKTTFNVGQDDMVLAARKQLIQSEADFVFANDVGTRSNLLVGMSPSRLHVYLDRQEGLQNMLKLVYDKTLAS